jgi:hypothetical protein
MVANKKSVYTSYLQDLRANLHVAQPYHPLNIVNEYLLSKVSAFKPSSSYVLTVSSFLKPNSPSVTTMTGGH